MSRATGNGRARWIAPALFVVAALAGVGRSPILAAQRDSSRAEAASALAGLTTAHVGQITAVAKPADLNLAIALAERADQPTRWYGLGRRDLGQLAIVVVRGSDGFHAVSRGRGPRWGAGLALPAARFVVIRADGDDPFRVLRHELAHIALHQSVAGRVPLWFDEGYAVLAAGEFTRFERLGLNLTVARGRVPDLDQLSNGLRADQSTAETAYALAGSAVSFIADRSATRSLEPLLDRLEEGLPFDSALVISTGMNGGRLEEAWQKELKRRYGLGLWLVAGGMWGGVAALVILAHVLRRRRDRPRRAQLDVGWEIPPEELAPESAPSPEQEESPAAGVPER